ncbi:unnamed protein product [Polarella glacialis]|uniref:Uncharacterized protein n=1 Tax=Polarella glacialis TaxID=89957 RepID=A0A813HWB4_POLGL|nr:unnamed protein product [Polarella glacialis]
MELASFLLQDWVSLAFGNITSATSAHFLAPESWIPRFRTPPGGLEEALAAEQGLSRSGGCSNATWNARFEFAAADVKLPFAAGPILGLTASWKLPPPRLLTPSCLGLWALACLTWSEKLADELLPSPLLQEPSARDALLLEELGSIIRQSQGFWRRSRWHSNNNNNSNSNNNKNKKNNNKQQQQQQQHHQQQQQQAVLGHLKQQQQAVLGHLASIASKLRPLASKASPAAWAATPFRHHPVDDGVRVLALICGPVSHEPLLVASERYSWKFRSVSRKEAEAFEDQEDPGMFATCMRAYEAVTRAELSNFDVALLMSPLTSMWDPFPALLEDTFYNIHMRAMQLAMADAPGMTGFPSLASYDGKNKWVWPVRQVRWQYWKLRYGEGPTGYAGTSNGCYLGESTSGTRLVSAAIVAAARPAGGSAFLSALDLAAISVNGRRSVQTCPEHYLFEVDWLPHVRLGSLFAISHQIEAATWLPAPAKPQVRCLVLSPELARRLVAVQGLVTPWCFRRALHAAIEAISGWWQAQMPGNIVVPVAGTLLGVIRGQRPMPWDHDADLVLASQHEFNFRMHIPWISSSLSDLGCKMRKGTYAADLGLFSAEISCRDSEGVEASVDVFFPCGKNEPVMREWAQHQAVFEATFLGATVHVDAMAALSLINGQGYFKKLIRAQGGLSPLQCFEPGHNACLPDCRSNPEICDFDDNFVHVDSWLH